MTRSRSRREFLRDLGVGAAALPFVGNLPSLGFANQARRKQRLVVMFSPNGIVPKAFWPDAAGKFPFEVGCDLEVYQLQPRLDIALTPEELRRWRRQWE